MPKRISNFFYRSILAKAVCKFAFPSGAWTRLGTCLLVILLLPLFALGQSSRLITYEQAVALALQNNYDILIARNNADVAKAYNTYGNAGFIPRVDLQASGTKSDNTTRQNFSSGLTVDQSGVKSENISSGAYLTWTIFDGLKMFATKQRLELLQQQGELALRLQMENTLEAVTLNYYQIVKQGQLIKGVFAAMSVSNERIKIAEAKKTLGSGSNVEVLQAKLDLNAQRSDLLTQKALLNEYKNNLIVLTKADFGTDFNVDTDFVFVSLKSIDEIRQKIVSTNTSIMMAQKNTLIYNQTIKELRSQGLPKLALNANYLFGRNSNAAGFTLLNQNLGTNYGFTFSWNVFNGLVTHNQVKAAKLQTQTTIFQSELTKMNLFSTAQTAYVRWMGNKDILALEEENIKLAEQSLLITTERLRLGLGNYLETKESQSSYEAAITRLVNARYNLKQSETTLRKLTGELIREN